MAEDFRRNEQKWNESKFSVIRRSTYHKALDHPPSKARWRSIFWLQMHRNKSSISNYGVSWLKFYSLKISLAENRRNEKKNKTRTKNRRLEQVKGLQQLCRGEHSIFELVPRNFRCSVIFFGKSKGSFRFLFCIDYGTWNFLTIQESGWICSLMLQWLCFAQRKVLGQEPTEFFLRTRICCEQRTQNSQKRSTCRTVSYSPFPGFVFTC